MPGFKSSTFQYVFGSGPARAAAGRTRRQRPSARRGNRVANMAGLLRKEGYGGAPAPTGGAGKKEAPPRAAPAPPPGGAHPPAPPARPAVSRAAAPAASGSGAVSRERAPVLAPAGNRLRSTAIAVHHIDYCDPRRTFLLWRMHILFVG